MKPYYFNYSEEIVLSNNLKNFYDSKKQLNLDCYGNIFINKYFNGTTIETKAIENSDEDIISLGTTIETFSREENDEDSIYLGPTVITENVEPSDEDDIYM